MSSTDKYNKIAAIIINTIATATIFLPLDFFIFKSFENISL